MLFFHRRQELAAARGSSEDFTRPKRLQSLIGTERAGLETGTAGSLSWQEAAWDGWYYCWRFYWPSRRGAADPLEEAKALNQQAVELYQAGRYQEALPLAQRALEINEKALGPEHPDTAASLNNLAGLYEAMGAYEKALPLYQRALKIREKALGPDHPDTANSLNNLAALYCAMGAYDKALPLYQRALKIREKALGPEHPDTGPSLNNLAMLYQSHGRL